MESFAQLPLMFTFQRPDETSLSKAKHLSGPAPWKSMALCSMQLLNVLVERTFSSRSFASRSRVLVLQVNQALTIGTDGFHDLQYDKIFTSDIQA